MRQSLLHSRANRLIVAIFRLDQYDRMSRADSDRLTVDDQVCEGLAALFRTSHVAVGPANCYRLGMIAHHAGKTTKASQLAQHAWLGGHPKAGWLYAASVDRNLVRRGKRQRFCTQYTVDRANAVLVLQPALPADDVTRSQLGLQPLSDVPESVPL